ncbi:MAG TPA: MoxR family ATPase [Bacteroidia bacterium]|jgi:MoxR-like ATPase|nr:MoxR family ATPase [Bacteroidia bacterium]
MESPEIFETRTKLTDLQNAIEKIRNEIAKIVVGQGNMVDLLITAMFSNGHVLLEGVPGVAKTMTAKLIARSINTGFSRISFTPDLMPSDVIGTLTYNAKNNEFEFKKGPVFSNIILADEINRAPAKTQAALFEVMEEHQVTVDGKTYPMAAPFMIIATQNPIEHEGTYRLPEAQLDRFLFKVKVDYPTKEQEVSMLTGFHNRKNINDIKTVSAVLSAAEVMDFQQRIRGLHIEANLINYISEIIQHTRHNKSLYLGASPRAAMAILSASKAYAALNGRDFVTPEDIQFVTYPILRHRIMLTAEKEMEGVQPDDIIKQIIQAIEVPR